MAAASRWGAKYIEINEKNGVPGIHPYTQKLYVTEIIDAEFLSSYGIPVTTSMAGMGCVSSKHESFIGGPSYAAGEVFHQAIRNSDCVLALGTVFGGLEGFGQPPLWSKKIKFIHVDIDPLLQMPEQGVPVSGECYLAFWLGKFRADSERQSGTGHITVVHNKQVFVLR